MPVPDIIQTWMNKAKNEVRAETRKKVQIIAAIQKAQLKLGEELTLIDELIERTIEELQALADEFATRLKA